MSDTPRTDSYVAVLIAKGADADSLEHFTRDLERELNAAKARIARLEARVKRLEEVGDMIVSEYMVVEPEKSAWKQAKETKP